MSNILSLIILQKISEMSKNITLLTVWLEMTSDNDKSVNIGPIWDK